MGSVRYAMVAGGSKMDASEVERDDAEVIDVTFLWGDALDRTVLAVKHLGAGESLSIGEAGGCDLLVPANALGESCAKIVERDGPAAFAIVPSNAHAIVDGIPSSSKRVELTRDRTVEITVGDFAVRLAAVAAPKRVAAPSLAGVFKDDGIKGVLGSALLHAMLIGAVAAFMPALGSTDDDDIDQDRIVAMQRFLNASAEREQERTKDEGQANDQAGGDSMAGQQAKGVEGQAGTDTTKQGHMALQGTAKRDEQTFTKERALADVNASAFLGLLASQSQSGPQVPWGSFQNGADDRTTLGSLFGQTLDDAQGTGGLGLHGPGEGGGGKNNWVGLNGMGGLGQAPGHCTGDGPCDGIGNGRTKLTNGHDKATFKMRPDGAATVNGRLDPAIIQRIIQQNWGRYRFCYEMGLRNNPDLAGHVGVKFVIDRSGAVAMAAESGSTLPDSNVNQCVARAFTALSFPAPDGGQVTVQYGFSFSPN